MGRPHFFCCFPVRFGAALITLFEACYFFPCAVAFWYLLIKRQEYINSTELKVITGIVAVIYSINVLVSLLALWGTLRKELSIIRPFIRVMAWELGVNIVATVLYCGFFLSRTHSALVSACDAIDPSNSANCAGNANSFKIGTVTGALVALCIQAYALWIVHQFAHLLEEEAGRNRTVAMGKAAFQYQQAPRRASEEALAAPPTVGYPYSDNQNSFGYHQGAAGRV